jgi:hypothetical protein
VYKILKDAASDFHDLNNLGDPDKDVAGPTVHWCLSSAYKNKYREQSHLYQRF